MEFFEAPAFTRQAFNYLADDSYRALQHRLAVEPELGDVMSAGVGFASFAGPINAVAKVDEAACESSTTTSRPTAKFGS